MHSTQLIKAFKCFTTSLLARKCLVVLFRSSHLSLGRSDNSGQEKIFRHIWTWIKWQWRDWLQNAKLCFQEMKTFGRGSFVTGSAGAVCAEWCHNDTKCAVATIRRRGFETVWPGLASNGALDPHVQRTCTAQVLQWHVIIIEESGSHCGHLDLITHKAGNPWPPLTLPCDLGEDGGGLFSSESGSCCWFLDPASPGLHLTPACDHWGSWLSRSKEVRKRQKQSGGIVNCTFEKLHLYFDSLYSWIDLMRQLHCQVP